jgi:hypothetical protein
MIALDFIRNPPRRSRRIRTAPSGVRNRSTEASSCFALDRVALVLPCVARRPSYALPYAHALPACGLPCVPARSVRHSFDHSPRQTPILERQHFVTPYGTAPWRVTFRSDRLDHRHFHCPHPPPRTTTARPPNRRRIALYLPTWAAVRAIVRSCRRPYPKSVGEHCPSWISGLASAKSPVAKVTASAALARLSSPGQMA